MFVMMWLFEVFNVHILWFGFHCLSPLKYCELVGTDEWSKKPKWMTWPRSHFQGDLRAKILI